MNGLLSRDAASRAPRAASVLARLAARLTDRRTPANEAVAAALASERPECSVWAAQGECEANPGYMLEGCRANCEETTTPSQVKGVCVRSRDNNFAFRCSHSTNFRPLRISSDVLHFLRACDALKRDWSNPLLTYPQPAPDAHSHL